MRMVARATLRLVTKLHELVQKAGLLSSMLQCVVTPACSLIELLTARTLVQMNDCLNVSSFLQA